MTLQSNRLPLHLSLGVIRMAAEVAALLGLQSLLDVDPATLSTWSFLFHPGD